MAWPSSYDTFTTVKNRGDSVTESHTLTASAVAFTVTTDFNILESVSFSGIYTTEVTTSPAATQFRVYYRSNQIELGPLASNATLNITYVTSGKAAKADHITDLNTAVTNLQETLGLNPQGTEDTLVDRLDVLASTTGMQAEIEDFTTDLDGATNIFGLSYQPVDARHVSVELNGIQLRFNTDYIVDIQNVVLSENPYSTDTLQIKYFRST